MKAGATGFKRLFRAFGYSCDGISAAWRHEAAFRQEFCLAAILLPLGLYLGRNASERALLCGSILLILVVELLNSGLEAITDRASPEQHELAKRAKDAGSAAVLLALLLALLVWGLILWPAT